MILAIALIYFKREKCQYVVLEVGLGGRFDATNVIKKPLITAITNIGLDHTNILGPRRVDIAVDKAGIIKKGCQFITTEEDREILRIFQETCREVGAKYHPINVSGLEYMEKNLSLAGHICNSLGIIDSPEKIDRPQPLPARFEIMERRPLVVIDGAHNPSKFESTLLNLKLLKYDQLSLVIAISADKDWRTMIKMVSPMARRICVTRFSVPGRQSVDPKLLFKHVQKHADPRCKVSMHSDPVIAYRSARKGLRRADALLIVGSFYLAGDIRALYCPESQILQNRSSF
ncbi:MAG: hypothetical protein WCG02_03520 [Candidatus Taylorbacteria bacterium]